MRHFYCQVHVFNYYACDGIGNGLRGHIRYKRVVSTRQEPHSRYLYPRNKMIYDPFLWVDGPLCADVFLQAGARLLWRRRKNFLIGSKGRLLGNFWAKRFSLSFCGSDVLRTGADEGR